MSCLTFICLACRTTVQKTASEMANDEVLCPQCGDPCVVAPEANQAADGVATVDDPGSARSFSPAANEADASFVERSVSGPNVPGYEILGILGEGGMGTVYQARHLKLKRLVALKMVRAGSRAGEHALERFRREAEAVARLQHANIVQVYEVGEHAGLPYFSLEYLSGGTLKDKVAGEPLLPRDAAHLVEILTRAVQAAHEQGVVHRDLKPANVLLATSTDGPVQQWTLKITDFGLAKQLDDEHGQTQTGDIMGTPSYMAPEQAFGRVKDIGPATDVYALGAILYDLLTARPPFKAASVAETLEQVRFQEPIAPSALQPKLPRDLDTICLKCLEKDPSRRYASAEALAEDLRRFRADEPIKARPSGVVTRTLKWSRRHPAVTVGLVASLVAAVLLIGMGGFWYQSERDASAKQLQLKIEEAERETLRARTEAGLRKKADDQTSKANDLRKKADDQTRKTEEQRKKADAQRIRAEKSEAAEREKTLLAEARAEEIRRGGYALQLARIGDFQARTISWPPPHRKT